MDTLGNAQTSGQQKRNHQPGLADALRSGELSDEDDDESLADEDNEGLVRQGYWLLFVTVVFFITTTYSGFVSKIIPDTGWQTLDAIKRDNYYCYLVPLTIPVVAVFAGFNWVGFEQFANNLENTSKA
ncbi:hypothetical protein HDU93_009565 [Gonapodya sp. JEL0774]|nr:hypothetical protein HDU93_009565 [Gonapodya sp. JEL0774]